MAAFTRPQLRKLNEPVSAVLIAGMEIYLDLIHFESSGTTPPRPTRAELYMFYGASGLLPERKKKRAVTFRGT